jgi:hypothetical protein
MLRGIAAYLGRHHVALLALFVAMGGTSLAATGLFNGNQIKRHTIPKDRLTRLAIKQLHGAQGARGPRGATGPQGIQGTRGLQGVPGPTFGATAMSDHLETAADPEATPDEPSSSATFYGRHDSFTLPAGGQVYIRFFTPGWGLDCSAGLAYAGIYLDGMPVPKTSHSVGGVAGVASPLAWETVGIATAGAGAHVAEVRFDCPNGDWTQLDNSNILPTWTVFLLG